MNDFRAAMAAVGINYAGEIIADGKLRRFKADGDKERNSWYVLHDGQPVAGAFGCWKRGTNETWCARNGHSYSKAEWEGIRKQWIEAENARKRTEVELQEKARATAAWILSRSTAVGAHEYLAKKDVSAHGPMKLSSRGSLVLPLRDSQGRLHTVQFINNDGGKQFLRGGRCAGTFYALSAQEGGPLIVCEGYATGATLFEATGYAIVCAMNAGNLLPVATALRAKYPEREIVIAADDDHTVKGNPGLTKATEAATAVKAKLAAPQFEGGQAGTDFNDLCAVAGLNAVREQIRAAKVIETAKSFSEIVEERRFNPLLTPPKIRPVFSLAGKPISTPGNLTTVNSQVKVGKSAVLGAIIASTTASEGADTLGFTSENPKGLAVLHFDTEQSKEDHWHLVHRSMIRARVSVLPPWILSYCLTGFPAKQALEAFYLKLKEAAQQFGGIHSVLLDGFADLFCDVNDPEECNAGVANFHGAAIDYDCPIVGVIHQNPGSEKTRGHLGSQLERKAETNLRLDKEGEVTEVWSEKQRRAPIMKGTGPRFKWSDEAGMHISVESGISARDAAKIEASKLLCEDVFNGRPSMRYSELLNQVQNTLKKSESTSKRTLAEWVHFGVIEKSVAGLWIPKG